MTTQLVVPGLLGPLPGLRELAEFPRFPALEAVLACADLRRAPRDYIQTLFQVFDLQSPRESDLPSASLCWLADTGQPPDSCLLHADPVTLHPDMDRLLLFGFEESGIDATEAASFVDAFNSHFAEDGLKLHAPRPQRWYLSLDASPHIRTHPLSDVLGRNIDPFLPTGPQAMEWHKLFTEIQMLFHGLSVNPEREARGQQPVNGLWFSGAGSLPEPKGRHFAQVIGEGPLLRGIGQLTATTVLQPVQEEARGWSSWSGEGSQLIVLQQPFSAVVKADPVSWLAAVEQVEEKLSKLLEYGLDFDLYPCNGSVYRWKPNMRRWFWRRKRPVTRYLDENSLPQSV